MNILILGDTETSINFEEIVDLYEKTTNHKVTCIYELGLPGVHYSAWLWAFTNKVKTENLIPGWRKLGRRATKVIIARILREKPVHEIFWIPGEDDAWRQEEALEGLKTRIRTFRLNENENWEIIDGKT